jgi:predicted CXXCH cytochrome family protein
MKQDNAKNQNSEIDTARRSRRRVAATAIGWAVTALVATTPGSVIAAPMAGGLHDLSSTSTGANKSDTQDQLCAFCHVPHNSQPAVSRPLWSHTMTTQNLTWAPVATVRGTTLPTSITGAALAGSRACMSCHDGTVALGDLLNGSGGLVSGANVDAMGKLTTGPNFLNPLAMESNHPLGVTQPAPIAGFTGFKTPAENSAVNYDASGYVQCGSCHNPHDNTFAPFLKVENTGSAICVTCHDL